MSSSESQSRAAYEAWHEAVYAEDATADRPWHDLVRRYLRPADLDGRHVLEIGCGRGELACLLAESEAPPRRLVAADFAHAAVRLGAARGRHRSLGGVSWMVADVQAVGLPDETLRHRDLLRDDRAPGRSGWRAARVLPDAAAGRPGRARRPPTTWGRSASIAPTCGCAGAATPKGGQPICRLTSLPRTWLWLRRAGFRVRAVDACGHYALYPGRTPWEPAWLKALAPLLWPFGLHSVFVAEKPGAAAGGAELACASCSSSKGSPTSASWSG